MTNLTVPRAAWRPAGRTAPPMQLEAQPGAPVSSAALVAGVALMVMSAVAVFANFIVLEGLVTAGDPATTATDITGSEQMFRLGILGWFVIAALDVAVAWALFIVFRPVNEAVARLGGWLRLLYTGVLVVAVTELAAAVRLLGDQAYLSVFDAGQLQAQALLRIDAFTDMYDAGLILFGLHLMVVGYLAFRSGYMPRVLGVLLGIAGAGYLVDSVTAVLGVPTNLGVVTFGGEFLLGLWLLVRWRRIPMQSPAARNDIATVTS